MIVGKGRFQVVKAPQEALETEVLGSCVGLAAVDAGAGVVGLWIFVLPARRILAQPSADHDPRLFAEDGLDGFLGALKEAGAQVSALKLVAGGGARFLEAPRVFDVGGLNASMLRKLLKDRGLALAGEKLGSPFPTRMRVEPDGKVFIKTTGSGEESW